MYNVIDRHTQTIVGTYSTFVRAMRARDKKDLAYGACRYSVVRVQPGENA